MKMVLELSREQAQMFVEALEVYFRQAIRCQRL